jgi:thiamine-phosphate pyrophosphorylase
MSPPSALLPSGLLLVTDRHLCARPLVETVTETVAAGLSWVWFRDRDLDPMERRRLGRQLHAAIAGRAAMVIGCDVELAVELGAAGVHLPAGASVTEARRAVGPKALIGVSAHTLADVIAADGAGADYVTLSPIFHTQSKPGYGPALGPQALSRAAQVGIPLLALGGLQPANTGACLQAGASGIAVMGGILAAASPTSAVLDYMQALRRSPLSTVVSNVH